MVGSGSGLDVANAVHQHGLRVAVIEKSKMGGTCLNRGCIPSKLLIHSADVAETIKRAHLFGIKVDGFSVDFPSIVQRVSDIIDSESDEIKKAFKNIDNPKLFATECKFVGEKIISLDGSSSTGSSDDNNRDKNKMITADKILIASGTRPRIPQIKGLEETAYITSDEALRLKKQPKVLTIIGGGYIACELAHFFGSLGSSINIIQRRDVLIPDEDEEVSRKFTEIFAKKYNVYLDCETEFVSDSGVADGSNNSNNHKFHVLAKHSGKSIEIISDQLLIAAGRIPNSDTLGLEKTGVKTNKKGYIITDRYLETNVRGIFALGDAIGRYLFKHSANYEAQQAYHNILHPDNKIPVCYYAMPHAIFSSPQVAAVGFTEQELVREQQQQQKNNIKNDNPQNNIEYQKYGYDYINTGMGLALDDRDGFVKFLVDKKDRRILGCHIIGGQASILIHEVLVAMKADGSDNGDGGTIDNITKTIHIHPALSEVVARAAANEINL